MHSHTHNCLNTLDLVKWILGKDRIKIKQKSSTCYIKMSLYWDACRLYLKKKKKDIQIDAWITKEQNHLFFFFFLIAFFVHLKMKEKVSYLYIIKKK